MDKRPESGVEGNLIYCLKKSKVVGPKLECALFVRGTQKNRDDMRNSAYGRLESEEFE